MADKRGDNSAFRRSIYRKTLLDIHSLGQKMPEDTLKALAREVLHRLTQQVEDKGLPVGLVEDSEIDALCHALLSEDVGAGASFVTELRNRGVELDRIYLAYLARAARRLGVWWEEDDITFLDVTKGTSRIYGIMRGLNPLFISSIDTSHKCAVFASCPGETHTLGIKMASDMFRKSGWDIDLKMGQTHDELVKQITQSSCSLIGLSAAGEHAVPALAKLIVALRVTKPECLILVSGNIVNVSTELVSLMAPDAMEVEFEEAEAALELLWERVS